MYIPDLVNPESGIKDGRKSDPGSGILDPVSGINIPDPQQCIRQKRSIK
jgi:hypothetical protein